MKRPEPSLLAKREAPIWKGERKRNQLWVTQTLKSPPFKQFPAPHPYTSILGTPRSLSLPHHHLLEMAWAVTSRMQIQVDLEVRCSLAGRRDKRSQGALTGHHVMSRPARK